MIEPLITKLHPLFLGFDRCKIAESFRLLKWCFNRLTDARKLTRCDSGFFLRTSPNFDLNLSNGSEQKRKMFSSRSWRTDLTEVLPVLNDRSNLIFCYPARLKVNKCSLTVHLIPPGCLTPVR